MNRLLLACTVFVLARPTLADDRSALERAISTVDPNVMVTGSDEERSEIRKRLAGMLGNDLRERRRAANLADVEAWRSIENREQWERFRDERIARLRASLGTFPEPPDDLHVRVVRTIEGNGFSIRCLLFESRPGLLVTANLYVPAKTSESMPGILICHSHHRPKVQGELQDMGMTWARAGCLVLVMDQLGHGERRAHPFAGARDYDGEFQVSRQDYHFRYDTGMQLHLLGDSLIGWMAWDLMRGVDLLLEQPGIDPERIALLGAVAGGGDPAAVTAAIDPRIKAVVPFNFGGPQPETTLPLPEDAELAFNYFGGGSWESTRNLRRSIGEGFPHWLIVASVAPRRLIHAHEFAWDEARDPVWRRYQRIFGEFYAAPSHLASAHGHGNVRLSSNEATHCTNIGPVHRAQIHPRFREWFGIEAEEYQQRLDESELLVLRGTDLEIPPLTEVAGRIADERLAAFRASLPGDPEGRRRKLRESWGAILGNVAPAATPEVTERGTETRDGVTVRRFVVRVERESDVPVVLLSSADALKGKKKRPTVVCVAQGGKAAFLAERPDVLAALLDGGCDVCLPDLRGTGETRPGSDRGRRSDATGLSSTELMFAETHVGSTLRDLRTLLGVLRKRPQFDGRFAIWADSFAPVNPLDRNVVVPRDVDDMPSVAEPLGHVLALLAGLYEEDVAAIASARGGLSSFRSALEGDFVCLPHDVIVPGAIPAGDLDALTAAIHPRPLLVTGRIDARNRRVEELAEATWLAERLLGHLAR